MIWFWGKRKTPNVTSLPSGVEKKLYKHFVRLAYYRHKRGLSLTWDSLILSLPWYLLRDRFYLDNYISQCKVLWETTVSDLQLSSPSGVVKEDTAT